MEISLDIVFFGTFGVIGFVSTVLHRMHAIQNLHHKGDVTANYWGTYAKVEEEPKKTQPKKSHYPKMTNKGTLTLPSASNQNMSCIAGKVTSRGK
ncbi:MAG: hypothetical protein WC028_13710 [Candidatus Obscuribacterales bacterium]|jgi:hypothetical protein